MNLLWVSSSSGPLFSSANRADLDLLIRALQKLTFHAWVMSDSCLLSQLYGSANCLFQKTFPNSPGLQVLAVVLLWPLCSPESPKKLPSYDLERTWGIIVWVSVQFITQTSTLAFNNYSWRPTVNGDCSGCRGTPGRGRASVGGWRGAGS